MKAEFDEKDIDILQILREDCSLSKKQIAKKLNLPLTTVHNRIQKLKNSGAIEAFKAVINWKKLGYNIFAYVHIEIKYGQKNYSQTETAKKIKLLEDVEEVSIVAGTTDIIAKIKNKSTEELNDFIINKLRKIEGVDKTKTFVILKEIN
ncbi:MAG: Lrp/AsnC family transcriptional regulator [Candidatus Micrarchaeota archaeon]